MIDPSTSEFPEIQSNRYRMLGILGSGGSGTVFKAEDTTLGITVAIKKLNRTASDTEAVRFQREAKMAATLNHPNVMCALDFGMTEKHEPYLVLAYVDGESLKQRLERVGSYEMDEALALFIQIAEGLSHAHQKNVIHRDIKPGNIILAANAEGVETVRIVDFGLAKQIVEKQDLTTSGAGIGTPMYMSPEQIRGKEVDARSDVYSFGCMMYEVLAGTPPFVGETVLETISMQLKQAPPRLSDHAACKIPATLDSIVHTCLRKDRDERYADATELLGLLEELQDDLQSPSEVVERDVSPSRPPKRLDWKVILISLAVIAIAAVPIVAIVFTSVLSEQSPQREVPSPGRFERPQVERSQYKAVKPTDDDLKRFLSTNPTEPIGEIVFYDSELSADAYLTLIPVDVLSLGFNHTPLTKQILENISKMPSLKVLRCRRNQLVDPEGLKVFQNKDIAELDLDELTLTEEHMKVLGKIKSLRTVALRTVEPPKGYLRYLKDLKHLRDVNLTGSSFDDDDITQLSALPVENLNLGFTNFGKRTIEMVRNMKSLKRVNLDQHGFIPDDLKLDIERLKKERPDLDIHIGNAR